MHSKSCSKYRTLHKIQNIQKKPATPPTTTRGLKRRTSEHFSSFTKKDKQKT